MLREKRPYMVITFDTTTQAMAMEKACRQAGIPGRLIPLPKEVSAACGLAWRLTDQEYGQWQPQINALPVQMGERVKLLL